MKKNLLPIILLFLASSIYAQEVPEVQQSLITKITATWCGNCGSWGWTLFEGLVTDNADQALVIANHHSGDLTNSTSEAIADNLGFVGQPKFFVNNTDQMVTSNMASIRRGEIKELADANAMLSPLANAGLNAQLDGKELTVSTKTKFFQASSGAYYLGVYLIENGVINFQSGQGMNASHKNVLRTSMSSNPFGEMLMDGNINMGMEFENTFTLQLEDSWNVDQLRIATIIWKKENDKYQFVNTHSTTEINMSTTAIEEISPKEFTMQLRSNSTSSSSNLFLQLNKNQDRLNLSLFDLLGRKQQVLYDGSITVGQYHYPIEMPQAGVYLIVAKTNKGILTKKLIIE